MLLCWLKLMRATRAPKASTGASAQSGGVQAGRCGADASAGYPKPGLVEASKGYEVSVVLTF